MALFGAAALFGRWVDLPATSIVLGRTAFAALALTTAAAASGRRVMPGRPTLALAVNGALLAFHWVAFFAAVQRTSVAIALVGYASFPLFVVLFERAQGAEGGQGGRVGRVVVAALVVAGLVLTAPSFAPGDRGAQGLLLGVLSGLAFAIFVLRNRSLVVRIEPLTIALWQNVAAALILTPIVLVTQGTRAPPLTDWMLLIVLGVACTALAHTLFIASMRRVSAHTASVVAALEPVYGIAFAAVLLAEIPPLRTLTGAVLIVIAAVVASRMAIR